MPHDIHEALTDPKLTLAIQEEMNVLLKNNTCTLSPLLEGKKKWEVYEFSLSNTQLMGQLKGTKQDWWQKDTHGHMTQITKKLSLKWKIEYN